MKTIDLSDDGQFHILSDSVPQPLQTPLTAVFSDNNGAYINHYQLFVATFQAVPNLVDLQHIDCKKANQWFLTHHGAEVKDRYFSKRNIRNQTRIEPDDIFYILEEELLVYFDTNCSTISILFRNVAEEKITALSNELLRFKRRREKSKPEISLLVNGMRGLDTIALEISKPKLRIEDNYNDDFQEIHKIILKRLSKKGDKGLVLLHGKPGTGKTSYIRYLITAVKKEVIFLPPNMAGVMTNPDLIATLMKYPNSILVIEDAENIIVDRDLEGRSPVSALLNISDGLLADCLSIQIVCSFNTDLSRIDGALLRKGRLIAKYEFIELAAEKANRLSEKLGFTRNIYAPMTLTDIYNQEEKDFQEGGVRKTIGFQR